MPTRIAFDARPLLGPRTGVGVWLAGLLGGLSSSTDWTFVLCLPRREEPRELGELRGRVEILAPSVRLPGTLWLTTVAAPLLIGQADAFVGTLGILPRRLSLPSVLVVHDLTPRTRPLHHTVANRYCFNAYFEDSVTRADEVVCVSRATRARLAEVLPREAARARVIGPGIDPFFSPAPAGEHGEDIRRRFADGRPFLLQLGTLEPRKGIAALLEAHAALLAARPDAPDLVLAGGMGWGGSWLDDALARHPRRERVHLPGYVTRDDAREMLRHAEVVVLASEEEGFGLPLAEALAAGAACVASSAEALVEVAEGAALHVPPNSPSALTAALEQALDPVCRDRLRAAAVARAGRLGWDRPVAAWVALLSAAAARVENGPTAAHPR